MLEFRKDARRALQAVQRGERLLLTYRGTPVARLEPVRAPHEEDLREDPIFRIEEFAGRGPGGKVVNEEIDRIVYGS